MNRFKNKPDLLDTPHREVLMKGLPSRGDIDTLPNPIYGIGIDDKTGENYQDLYDQLADDYRGGYFGDRKTKLLLYIEHRAMRDYGVVIHTGTGFSRFDAEDTHHGDPAVIAGLCDDYDTFEREEVQEYLVGIR